MASEWTDVDFDALSWHDNALHGLRLDPADPDAGDWRSDLVLSIDHIVEWVGASDGMQFRVAPALLTFHDVGGLSIAVDWQGEMLHDMAIDSIECRAAAPAGPKRDVQRWNWHIAFNWPAGGAVSFVGGGFTLRLLDEPSLLDKPSFSPTARRAHSALYRL
jgi:hypothetical protein